MKRTAITTVCCLVVSAVLLPLVATFALDGLLRHRSMSMVTSLRMAVDDDVPEIVKAYTKMKPQVKVPELSLPPTPSTTAEAVTTPLPDPPSLPSPPEGNVPDMSDFQSSVSESMGAMQKSLPTLQETADTVNAQFQGLNDFFKATQAQAAASTSASQAAASQRAATGGGNVPTLAEMIAKRTEPSSSVVLPHGRAPTLVEYVLQGFHSPTDPSGAETLMESKAKLIQLFMNIFSLPGKSSSLTGAATIDSWEAFTNNLPADMTPETATAIGAATIGVLVIAGQNNKSKPSTNSASVAATAAAVPVVDEALLESVDGPLSGLAKDVKKMAAQIQALSDETKKLRAEVKEAQNNLMRKDLEMGKERLKAADNELKFRREIQAVTLKLQQSEAKSKALAQELQATMDIKATLKDALTKIKQLEDQLQTSQAPSTTIVATPDPVVSQLQPEPLVEKPKPVAVVPAQEQPAPAPKKVPAKKAPAPKAAAKKSSGPKGATAQAATPDEEQQSSAPPATKIASKTKKAKGKAKSKPKAAKKVEEPPIVTTGSDDTDDWSTLSATTLTRKTVKELMDYLMDKGVPTNDDDGKPLKKALLVEAVQAL